MNDGPDRIAAAFAGHGQRAALMPYLMGGYPDIDTSRRAVLAAVEAGADLVELGIPFSDPLADGPVIHAAGTEALRAGVTLSEVLALCESVAGEVPVVLMVYANQVLTHGAEHFVRRAAGAGAAGIIVPDLPYDEAGGVRETCAAQGVALVPLVAPTSSDERVEEIARDAQGFVYAVSLTGTTGERADLPPELEQTVERIKGATELPVAVGFGVSTGEHARRVAEVADGVIVGSRVVRATGEGGPDAVREIVGELAAALAPE